MFTTSFRDTCLGQLGGFIGLIKAISDWRAGTITEAAYPGYGTRPGITWSAAENTSPAGGRQRKNSAVVTFPQNTGSNEDQIAFGVFSAATAGTLQAIGLLDTDVPLYGVGNVDDTIDSYAHGLAADQRVYVMAAPGAIIPTGLVENTAYYVRGTGLGADVFTLSATQGGAAVNITVGGAALFAPYKPVTVATNATPEFAINALLVQI